MEQQPTTERRCPRCGAVLPPEAYYEKLGESPDRYAGYVVRHQRKNQTWCTAYAGPEKEEWRAS